MGRGAHFPRGERHDRFPGRHEPRRKVATPSGVVLQTSEVGRLGGSRVTRRPRWASGGRGRFRLGGTARSAVRPPAASLLAPRRVPQGLWRPRRHPIRPVLKHGPRSLTRARVTGLYETQRHNESEGPPSRWAQVGSRRASRQKDRRAHHWPVSNLTAEAEQERARWDPKDGELCLSRSKPEETLVEDRSDSDVQIDRQTWV